MYFSEGPNFLLVWGQNFSSGGQDFSSGGQIYFSRGQNFVSGGQITKLNWCQN